MRPLIDESVSEQPEVNENLAKFSETASNRVPLVVIGNYSGGKSTFINALIGKDILSSSEQPLTAKIYRILDLKEEGKARISFQYLGEDVEIEFSEEGYKFTKGGTVNELAARLEPELKDITDIDKMTLFKAVTREYGFLRCTAVMEKQLEIGYELLMNTKAVRCIDGKHSLA